MSNEEIVENRKSQAGGWLTLLLVLAGGILIWQRGQAWLRAALIYLSGLEWARELVSANPVAWQVASRFVAGVSIEDAIAITRQLNDEGLSVTLDYLGESVQDEELACAARDEISNLLDAIFHKKVDANVSLKLTQLGIALDKELAYQNLRSLLVQARAQKNRIRVDMEDSFWVNDTLAFYRRLREEEGLDNVGVVIQSYLYRSLEDIQRLVDEGAWVRLVKGAYLEPPDVAYTDKSDTDAMFVREMQLLLSQEARRNGVYAGIATHDEDMIRATIDFARDNGISPEAYEFQMLYGVRRERQLELVKAGFQMRVYVPYGTHWYPYFLRRLAERPANLWFFLSNFFK
jgi:proline dehydrogenase